MGVNGHLLDTHTFVWAASTPERLSGPARDLVADPTSSLWTSAATAWELAIKHRQGRLPEADVLVTGFALVCERLRVGQLPIASSHALAAGALEWSHRDPFDRMLAAQAMVEGLTLVTADRAFASLRGLATLW